MATWHKAADPLLNSDIPALAHTVSCHTHTCAPGEDLGEAMAAAVVAASAAPGSAGAGGGGAGSSRVATLIVPHDLSWQPAAGGISKAGGSAAMPATAAPTAAGGLAPGAQQFVREAAAALRACPRGKAALYLGGRAALAQGKYCAACGREESASAPRTL